VNCAINPTTAEESVIGGINDRIYSLFGDIADMNGNSTVAKFIFIHFGVLSSWFGDTTKYMEIPSGKQKQAA
jgi:hypothetical protein